MGQSIIENNAHCAASFLYTARINRQKRFLYLSLELFQARDSERNYLSLCVTRALTMAKSYMCDVRTPYELKVFIAFKILDNSALIQASEVAI
jgi:hypothetical protein